MARFIPFILKTDDEQKIGVRITRMKKADAAQTEKEPVWQTSWMSAYIQKDAFEKYALKTTDGELVALAAYEILENDVMVHITYIESQPESNPTIVGHLKQRFRSWQNTMFGIMARAHCRVLAERRVMNCLARRL